MTKSTQPRDVRLDVFRGLGMFIIYVAHVPGNAWNLWIPAAFGASDATEIFVFCSGAASGLAFGGVFRRQGALMGLARTLVRMWQVYWAHIGLFMVLAALLVLFDRLAGAPGFYTDRLYVLPFFTDPAGHILGLMTLSYVPNYFDILPMYLVLLGMMPVVALLGLQNRWLAFALVVGVYALAQGDVLWFEAEVVPQRSREWYFNPFAWQLVFFAGFAITMGWLKPPPVHRTLVLASLGILAVNLVVASRLGWDHLGFVWPLRNAVPYLFDKTDLGVMRVLHFAAIAYLAYVVAGPAGSRLPQTGPLGAAMEVVRGVGQQALAVFLAGMVLAQVAGFALDHTGRGPLALLAANAVGFAALIVVARVVSFTKSEPWRRPRAERAAPPAPVASAMHRAAL